MNDSTMIKTKILVLGGGPGGYSAAFGCADLGMKTIIVERYPNLGGVCLNCGCIPSKALLSIAKVIKENKNLEKYGIFKQNQNPNFNIEKIELWKNNIINKLSTSLDTMAKTRDIRVIHGVGKFIDDHTLQVLDKQEILKIQFDYAIIATGSQPDSLDKKYCIQQDQRIWNSTDALSLKEIPKKLLIIGSGSIGLEMATVYQAFGSSVDLIESRDQIAPFLDKDISNIFSKILLKTNINCITNTNINTIIPEKDGIYINIKNNSPLSTNTTHRYDAVLISIGRKPNNTELNLEKIGVNLNKSGFITINKQMRTNISNIFAIGDIVGSPMLAHKSIHQGRIVAEIISGKKYFFDPKVIPCIIYSDPEISWVGHTEKLAQKENIHYESVIFPWTALGKAYISSCTQGITKLIFDKQTNRIIGGSILGTNASEMIGEISLSIEMGCDAEDISLTVHAHPTFYESIELASLSYQKSAKKLYKISENNH